MSDYVPRNHERWCSIEDLAYRVAEEIWNEGEVLDEEDLRRIVLQALREIEKDTERRVRASR